MSRRSTAFLLLAALFAFRLIYGLSMPFWLEDERQVYLVGLQAFARGEWPYFGADLIWTGGQLPGALLGWMIRLPLAIWPAPESPVVFLNLLSFAALALLAWYLTRRLPLVPRWLVWWSLFTLPWTLNFSTHIINPSYVLAGAIVFFVGFFEALPALSRQIIPFTLAWAMMGAGVLWVLQLHLSWVLLVPYVLFALAANALTGSNAVEIGRGGVLLRATTGFIAGAMVPGSLLLPTIVMYGWDPGHTQGAVHFHLNHPRELLRTTARVLSFASFEVPRFLGMSTAERVFATLRQPLIVLAVLPPLILGFLHPLWMLFSAFRRSAPDRREWWNVRILLVVTILLIFANYFFSIRGPQSHSFYVVFPIATLLAFTCWNERAHAKGGRLPGFERVAIIVLAANMLMHAGIAIDHWSRQSLYIDRALIVAAINDRNERYLGDRRETVTQSTAQNHAPRPSDHVADVAGFTGARATDDLRVVASEWTPRFGRFSSFALTVQNQSRVAAWLDIRFTTSYSNAAGDTIASREVIKKEILQPGESRRWVDVADDNVPPGATSARIQLIGAEKVIPRR